MSLLQQKCGRQPGFPMQAVQKMRERERGRRLESWSVDDTDAVHLWYPHVDATDEQELNMLPMALRPGF